MNEWKRATKEGTSTSVERNLELEYGIMEGGRGESWTRLQWYSAAPGWTSVGARVVVVGKSEVSQFRGDRGGAGSGVDEQFARQRTLRLSAVEATLPLHRGGRDKLGVEDAALGGGEVGRRCFPSNLLLDPMPLRSNTTK